MTVIKHLDLNTKNVSLGQRSSLFLVHILEVIMPNRTEILFNKLIPEDQVPGNFQEIDSMVIHDQNQQGVLDNLGVYYFLFNLPFQINMPVMTFFLEADYNDVLTPFTAPSEVYAFF